MTPVWASITRGLTFGIYTCYHYSMRRDTSFWDSIALGLQVCGTLLTTIAGGGAIGWWFATRWPSLGAWPILVGLLLGLVVGIWLTIRLVSQKD